MTPAQTRWSPVASIVACLSWGCQGGPEGEGAVIPVEVNAGPAGDYVNGLFASLTLCIPGSDTCQTIDGLLVDTGSVGLRILGSALAMALPAQTSEAGEPLAECASFLDQVAWGPVHTTDLWLGGEKLSAMPVQVIDDRRFRRPPDCTGNPITDVASLGAKGILGLGMFAHDCGEPCAGPVASVSNPGMYYACGPPAGDCGLAAVPVARQLPHPVTRLTGGNANGLVVQLDDAPAGGAPSVRGAILLGIGTRPDNALGGATKLVPDHRGLISVSYRGAPYGAAMDTGSNATYFLHPALSGLPACPAPLGWFYCPKSPTEVELTLAGAEGGAVALRLPVGDASALLAQTGKSAHRELAGPLPGFSATSPGFVLGLPVHFGRRVFIAIEGQNTPAGPGPFLAL